MKKALIIDGNSIINRAFYGIKNMSTKEGFPTNAIYGFLNVCNSVVEELAPEYMVVCFDMKQPTFRHIEYKDYKATRKSMPDELRKQMPVIKDILSAMNIAIVELEGFEADDLLGTIASRFSNEEVFSYLLTGDKDSFQLVNDMTSVYYHGTRNKLIYNPQKVFEDMGVYPSRVSDLKGLMGDSSDNIPGVKGIGRVSALKLLKDFDSVESIVQNIEDIKNPRMKKLLESGYENAVLSKKLATIITDIPAEISIDDYILEAPNYDELSELYQKYSLRKFLRLLQSTNPADSKASSDGISKPSKDDEQISLFSLGEMNAIAKQYTESESNFEICRSSKDIDGFISNVDFSKDVYIYALADIKNIFDDRIHCLGISDNSSNEMIFNREFADRFLKKISEKNIVLNLMGHDIKPILLILNNYKNIKYNVKFDSKIAMYLIDANRKNIEINDLALDYTSIFIMNDEELLGKGVKRKKHSDLEPEIAYDYVSKSIQILINSIDELKASLNNMELNNLYYSIELPLVEVLASIQYDGISIDSGMIDELDEKISSYIAELEHGIYKLAGTEFNINSPKQLSIVLFEDLKLWAPKKTKTGYSTSQDVLLKIENDHEIIPLIMEYRTYAKLKSTYVEGLRNVINPISKKIHSNFNQTIAATGRLSSTEPNLQNIPVRIPIGREFRKIFVASKGCKFLDADYSQIELRVLAHMSDDPTLKKAYMEDIDIHTLTASQVFNTPIDEVTSELRGKAKAVNFGIIYGMSDFGLSENLKITRKTAKKYIEDYFKNYPKVSDFMKKSIDLCKEHGYSETLLGRKRYIPEILSKNYNVRQYGERMAMNTPIQGTAADIIKIAMVRVYKALKERGYKSRLILQVHDELIIDTYEDELDEVRDLMIDCMDNALKLSIPLVVEVQSASSWYDAK